MNKTRTGNLKIKCPHCKQEHIVYKNKIQTQLELAIENLEELVEDEDQFLDIDYVVIKIKATLGQLKEYKEIEEK